MNRQSMEGIININKPKGMTSNGVVIRMREITGIRKIGHCGTLDPIATGVLLLSVGRYTKYFSVFSNYDKTYAVDAMLGKSTDTYDADGKVTAERGGEGINPDDINAVLPKFRGKIMQVPPMFSAKKVGGQELYKIARRGKVVHRDPVEIEVKKFELIDFQQGGFPVAKLLIECSKGTYVRSLCHDIGEMLGCGAHVKDLVRTRVGDFKVEDSLGLDEFEERFKSKQEINIFRFEKKEGETL